MIRRICFFIALLLGTACHAAAQDGLQIASLFGGRYKGRADATEVHYEGKQLRSYKLTLFRSLTLTPSLHEAAAIEKKVWDDCVRAVEKEVGLHGGRLYYGFYRLPDTGKAHRYVFYRNNALRNHSNGKLTLIYMEGSASIEDLKRDFAK